MTRRKGSTPPCGVCGKPITGTGAKFCSRQCADDHQRRNGDWYTCKTCSKSFYGSPSDRTHFNRMYCSIPCRDKDPERADMLRGMNAELQERQEPTSVELLGAALLSSLGLVFETQVLINGRFTVDALVADTNVIVEFDGDYWHGNPISYPTPDERQLRQARRDRSHAAYLSKCGYVVVRLWESDLKANNDKCVATVNVAMAASKPRPPEAQERSKILSSTRGQRASSSEEEPKPSETEALVEKTDRYTLYCGAAQALLREMPSESVDVIFTDPPYSSLEKHRKVGSTTRLAISNGSSNNWFPVMDNHVLLEHCAEMLRVLKPGRHAYFMCDPATSYDVLPLLLKQGWNWGNRLIWHKTGGFGMGYHYRRSYEDILFLWKGPKTAKRRLASASIPDLLPFPRLKGPQYWPTEKPSALIETLLRQSTEPGELVLDPFCGSGSTGEAAFVNGCRFMGIDITPEAIRRTTARLQGFQPGSQPPPAPDPIPEPPEEADEAPEPVQAAPAPKPRTAPVGMAGMMPLFRGSGPVARTTDPGTSWAAARLARVNASTNREAALRALCAAGAGGLTDFQLADVTGVQQTSIGKRRGELVESGFVEGVPGLTRPSPSNSPAIVWRATARAMALRGLQPR